MGLCVCVLVNFRFLEGWWEVRRTVEESPAEDRGGRHCEFNLSSEVNCRS